MLYLIYFLVCILSFNFPYVSDIPQVYIKLSEVKPL